MGGVLQESSVRCTVVVGGYFGLVGGRSAELGAGMVGTWRISICAG